MCKNNRQTLLNALGLSCYQLFSQKKEERIKERLFKLSIHLLALWLHCKRFLSKDKKTCHKIGLLTPEFFHSDCGGFGGYGANLRKITDYVNGNGGTISADILLTRAHGSIPHSIKKYHNAFVLFRPNHHKSYLINFLRYSRMARGRGLNLLISIDWYKDYEYSAYALPMTPLLIWIRDPRSLKEWQAIATVPQEMQASGHHTIQNIENIVNRKRDSINRIVKFSRQTGRKIVFATQAKYLIARAREAYGLDVGNPILLPKPLNMPNTEEITYSKKPSLGFLGRLEPIKRPWIFFELAKRFPHVDFLVAGKSHFPEIMDPIIKRYSHLPNLKFLGMLAEEQKDEFLRNIWGLLLPSIHEAMPNVFEEAFSYCKPVVSCQNPDNVVAEFGFYTGEILGQGLDNNSLDAFSKAVEELLTNHALRKEKGIRARKHVAAVNSFSYFENTISKFLADCN